MLHPLVSGPGLRYRQSAIALPGSWNKSVARQMGGGLHGGICTSSTTELFGRMLIGTAPDTPLALSADDK